MTEAFNFSLNQWQEHLQKEVIYVMKLQVLTLQNRKLRTQDKEQAALAHALPHHGSSQDRKGQCIGAQSVPTALTQGQSRDPLPKACLWEPSPADSLASLAQRWD